MIFIIISIVLIVFFLYLLYLPLQKTTQVFVTEKQSSLLGLKNGSLVKEDPPKEFTLRNSKSLKRINTVPFGNNMNYQYSNYDSNRIMKSSVKPSTSSMTTSNPFAETTFGVKKSFTELNGTSQDNFIERRGQFSTSHSGLTKYPNSPNTNQLKERFINAFKHRSDSNLSIESKETLENFEIFDNQKQNLRLNSMDNIVFDNSSIPTLHTAKTKPYIDTLLQQREQNNDFGQRSVSFPSRHLSTLTDNSSQFIHSSSDLSQNDILNHKEMNEYSIRRPTLQKMYSQIRYQETPSKFVDSRDVYSNEYNTIANKVLEDHNLGEGNNLIGSIDRLKEWFSINLANLAGKIEIEIRQRPRGNYDTDFNYYSSIIRALNQHSFAEKPQTKYFMIDSVWVPYAVKRYYELGKGHGWQAVLDKGSEWEKSPWDKRLPSDARLLVHFFFSYLDIMSPLHNVSVTHFVGPNKNPPTKEGLYFLCSHDISKFSVKFNGNDVKIRADKNRVYTALVLFISMVKKHYSGVLELADFEKLGLLRILPKDKYENFEF